MSTKCEFCERSKDECRTCKSFYNGEYSLKIQCRFCEKQNKGKCKAKGNISVNLTKRRKCSKFVFSMVAFTHWGINRNPIQNVHKEYEHRNLIKGVKQVEQEQVEKTENKKDENLIIVP